MQIYKIVVCLDTQLYVAFEVFSSKTTFVNPQKLLGLSEIHLAFIYDPVWCVNRSDWYLYNKVTTIVTII